MHGILSQWFSDLLFITTNWSCYSCIFYHTSGILSIRISHHKLWIDLLNFRNFQKAGKWTAINSIMKGRIMTSFGMNSSWVSEFGCCQEYLIESETRCRIAWVHGFFHGHSRVLQRIEFWDVVFGLMYCKCTVCSGICFSCFVVAAQILWNNQISQTIFLSKCYPL